MEKEYWDNYYKTHQDPHRESPFASYISKYLEKDKSIIELGSGNGRDSIYFSKLGLDVIGIDQCESEISYLREEYSLRNLKFISGDFTRIDSNRQYNYIYSRFTLHSIDEDAENRVLNWAHNSLNKGGLFFLELRSVKDDMYNKGVKKDNNVSVTNHYRRFAELNKLENKFKKKGFEIIESIESNGLAKYGDEDPVVIRLVLRKSN